MEILSKARRADVTFHRSGRIDISSRAAEQLGLRHGDAINAASSAAGNLFIYICCKRQSAKGDLRGVCKRTTGLGFRAYSASLCAAMIKEGAEKASYASISAAFVKEYGRMLRISMLH